MNRLVLLTATVTVILTSCAGKYTNEVFGNDIVLDDGCSVNISSKNQSITYAPQFEATKDCRLVTHEHTNILNIKYVNGQYVFFLESNQVDGEDCTSEYTALGISNDGDLYVTDFIKNSGSCYQNQEQNAFEYFSAKLQKYQKANNDGN